MSAFESLSTIYLRVTSSNRPSHKAGTTSIFDAQFQDLKAYIYSSDVNELQLAANVVQASTKEFTAKVRDGGCDHKLNET
ncbi:hypothetical protein L2E82_25902 [Cichorium intybus]|uniref:Uncharacterized protein n=1 Tax=Cichorium intybus TaxID=13427 RepID=A0ACB9E5F1_CICIN|nr:hypothetical protein L2E82_25902 [Cichorium intybus]